MVKYELGMFARRICSYIFLNGLSHDLAFELSCPLKLRGALKFKVDEGKKRVSVTYRRYTRVAQFCDDQGSVVLPLRAKNISFTPIKVTSNLPPANTQAWPMGDSTSVDRNDGIERAIDCAFDDPYALTAAVLVVRNGLIIGERYAPGVNKDSQLESWSMGKSLLATLFARLVLKGAFTLNQRVPVPAWRNPGDPRGKITIRNLLQMSSGLKFSAPTSNPKYSSRRGYPQHMHAYTDGINIYDLSRALPIKSPAPRHKGRYHNCDPWVIGSLIKDYCLNTGEEYLSFPQRELLDLIGIRQQVIETDPFGNLIFTGCDYGTARNWARLGLLYLQKGFWNGEQILPHGWTDFVSSPAPNWEKKVYGGQFWLNRTGHFPMLPKNTYFAAGGGGQYTLIMPKHNMVVVRMGYYPEMTVIDNLGTRPPGGFGSGPSTHRMLTALMEAIK
jgi:CubicO group peptidase (beta-lactamase class C family)